MFRLFHINCAKSFLSPAQHHTEVLLAQSGLLQDLFFRFFFQIEAAQDSTIALGELFQALTDGFAELEQVGVRNSLARRLRYYLWHRLVTHVAAAVLRDHISAD